MGLVSRMMFRMKTLSISLVGCLAIFAGCVAKNQKTAPVIQTKTTSDLSCCAAGSPEANLQELDVQGFNERIRSGEEANADWVKNPIWLSLELIGSSMDGMGRKQIETSFMDGERASKARITVVEDHFRDDSVAGRMNMFHTQKKDSGAWEITRAFKGQRCWRGNLKQTTTFFNTTCP